MLLPPKLIGLARELDVARRKLLLKTASFRF
jgi:hypothetical protein